MNIYGDSFSNGITNGAAWYHLAGGMQDWQYIHSNCFEITIEMGCFKFPYNQMLPQLWDEHKYSLFAFLEFVQRGIYSLIFNFSIFYLFFFCALFYVIFFYALNLEVNLNHTGYFLLWLS